jgi:hypothetical protein
MGVGGGQPHAPAASTLGKDPVPIVQEVRWAPGPVWAGGKSRPHWDSIPDRPARSQSLYQLSYPAHKASNNRKKHKTPVHNQEPRSVDLREWR